MTVTAGALAPVERIGRDIRNAATLVSDQEARFLVDIYYQVQEFRKASAAQMRTLGENGEPNLFLGWTFETMEYIESQIKRALDRYTDQHEVGVWSKSIVGIGPVIAAGLLAHIDIEKAPTVGHIWSFAGLNPTVQWNKGEKRPWNADLKTLCWKIGESFVKVSNNERDVYGKVYQERKAEEETRNAALAFKDQADNILTRKRIGKDTEAYKAYSVGMLPPAHIHARAKRYAVKLFLAHLHCVWYYSKYKTLPPKPYVVEHLGHANIIWPPNLDYMPGLREAIRAQGPWNV